MSGWLGVWLLSSGFVASQETEKSNEWKCVQSIPLAEVEGRIDHMVCDLRVQRLFVAALGNGSLEILDLAAGKVVGSVRGLDEPQGLVVFPERGIVAFTCGGDGKLHVVDVQHPSEPKVLHKIAVGGDPDNLRLDAAQQRLYVGAEKALAVVDVAEWKLLSSIALDGHAESFQLEEKGPRVFVNVPGARHVAVVDRTQGSVVATWPLGDVAGNYPMALDEGNGRLFIGCRQPARLLVLDTRDGRRVASLDCSGDCDDLFIDSVRRRLYASCGEGHVSIFDLQDSEHPRTLAKIPTASGARTALFVPHTDRFYLAVPHRGEQSAEIRVFEVANGQH